MTKVEIDYKNEFVRVRDENGHIVYNMLFTHLRTEITQFSIDFYVYEQEFCGCLHVMEETELEIIFKTI